jgi:hypothetical protein
MTGLGATLGVGAPFAWGGDAHWPHGRPEFVGVADTGGVVLSAGDDAPSGDGTVTSSDGA